jgi:hypothetical protein
MWDALTKELAREILSQCNVPLGADYVSLPGSALDKLAVWKASLSFEGSTSAWFRLLQEAVK